MALLQGIEEFVAIVDEGSMTAAAERLGVSVARVSRQLERLEDRLGVRLLERSTRRHSLTPEGERFYQQVSPLTTELRALTEEIGDHASELSGPIRLASPGGYMVDYMAPRLARFSAEHPEVTIDWEVSSRVVDLVSEPLDLAVRQCQLEDSSLVARKLFERRLALCASPDYLRARPAPEHPDQLSDHDCLVGCSDRWPFRTNGQTWQVRVNGRWHSDNGAALLEAGRQGLGLLYQPLTLVHEALEQGELVEVLADFTVADVPVWAVHPSRRHVPARVRRLIEYLVN
ncbi:LysR family transcriptional regulator [Thiohalorhabdus sp. Cl-TMA]|uniref:LysR family transcriptional regulator n=1 Tax=Thiohalorhabdus methylotrophus TaxID=3242694 RepID=A0ABV4U007_9GAMM